MGPAVEKISDLSPARPPAAQPLDGSLFHAPGADAVVDAAPPPVIAAELPAGASTRAPDVLPTPWRCSFSGCYPTSDPLSPYVWQKPEPPPETAQDAERRRLRGSPADVHTPEGAARGYRVNRHCPNYAPGAIAVIGTGTKDIPQLGRTVTRSSTLSSEEIEKEFWAFWQAVRRTAAVSSIHGGEAGRPCFDGTSAEDAVVLHLHDWRQVDEAIHNVGSWLAAHDWKGDIILWPQPIPGPVYPK